MAKALKMPQINDVRLSGRLTRDPQSRNTTSGDVVEFSLAVDRGFGDKKKTAFFQVNAWNETTCRRVMTDLRKGMAVIVDGELWPEEWTDRDGKKQSKTRITMRRFWTLEWPDDMQSEGPSKSEPEHDDIPF